jgi:hypothetical protein
MKQSAAPCARREWCRRRSPDLVRKWPGMKQTGAHFPRGIDERPAVSVTIIYTRRFNRQDGTRFVLDEHGTREVLSHRALPQTFGEIQLERFGAWVRASQYRFDLALAAVSFFLVSGSIFLAFGLAGFAFVSSSIGWTFWLLGFGQWGIAMTFFFSFMNWPQPRHSRSR